MKKFNDKQRAAAGVKREQFPLIEDTIPDVPHTRTARPWYYLTRNLNAEMLMGFDAYGNPVWIAHDMRNGDLPHLYNCSRRAQEAAVRLSATVCSCHYDRHAKGWKPYAIS